MNSFHFGSFAIAVVSARRRAPRSVGLTLRRHVTHVFASAHSFGRTDCPGPMVRLVVLDS